MTSPEQQGPPADNTAGEKETGRIEAFSDGVFAIAITLLVLDLRVPPLEERLSSGALLAALGREWPSYVAFLISFATVLIMWMNHHNLFKLVRRADAQLMATNGFLLLLVTAVPFPTSLVSDYLATPAAKAACMIYGGTFVLIGLAFSLLWRTVSRDRPLVTGVMDDRLVRRIDRTYRLGVPIYLAATLLALWNAYFTIAICAGLWVVWAFDVYDRWPVRR